MGAHSSPESVLAAVETDAVRLRAAMLVAKYDDHMDPIGNEGSGTDWPGYMDHDAWLAWEGQAYAVLREVARG